MTSVPPTVTIFNRGSPGVSASSSALGSTRTICSPTTFVSLGRGAFESSDHDRDGDAHAATGVGAVAGDFALEVEGQGPGQAGGGGADPVGDELGGEQPAHLELDPVGVAGVQRLGGDVV